MYNILAIPIAAGVLYPWVRVTLPPMVAAAAMVRSLLCFEEHSHPSASCDMLILFPLLQGCSSVSVVLSSLALKRYQPPSNSGFHSIALD